MVSPYKGNSIKKFNIDKPKINIEGLFDKYQKEDLSEYKYAEISKHSDEVNLDEIFNDKTSSSDNNHQEQEKSLWEKGLDWLGSAGATIAVATTSVVSGVLDIGEAAVDGVTWTGGKLVEGGSWLVGKAVGIVDKDAEKNIMNWREDTTSGVKDFIKTDWIGEASKAIYENTEVGKIINDASYLKYDSKTAQGIRKTTEKATVFVLATAATVATGGGAAAVFVPTAAGFAYGTGKSAEETYSTYGTDTTFAQEANIFINGVGEAANWYAQGKLGQGGLSLVNSVNDAGLKATGAALWNGANTTIGNIKTNGLLKTITGSIKTSSFTSLKAADNLIDSIGVVGNNISGWLTGEEKFNATNALKASGELASVWALNMFFDGAIDYTDALNKVSKINLDSQLPGLENYIDDQIEEAAIFGNSSKKEGFLASIFTPKDLSTKKLTTEEKILRDKINDFIKKNGAASITFNSTAEFSTALLESIDDLSKLNVTILGGFLDLNGKIKPKYNKHKYLTRVTYPGYEALAISKRLDELTSMIDLNLPTAARAKQIYEIISAEVPPRHDYEQYSGQKDIMDVFQSLRGITRENIMGREGLICAGYAQVYKELCTRSGITCDYIRGKAYLDVLRSGKPGGHAWNMVINGNEVIPVEVTWKACGESDWFGGSEAFVQRHIADPDEWFHDFSAPKGTFEKIAEALNSHDNKYGLGVGLTKLEMYLADGNIDHITSSNGARETIRQIPIPELQKYVNNQKIQQVIDIMTHKYGYQNAIDRISAYISPVHPQYGDINLITKTGNARFIMAEVDMTSIIEFMNGGN